MSCGQGQRDGSCEVNDTRVCHDRKGTAHEKRSFILDVLMCLAAVDDHREDQRS